MVLRLLATKGEVCRAILPISEKECMLNSTQQCEREFRYGKGRIWRIKQDEFCCKFVSSIRRIWDFMLKIYYNFCVKFGFSVHVNDGKDYFSNLHDDVIFDILIKLPAQDLLNCKLVCLRWHHLLSSQHFVDAHAKKTCSLASFIMFDALVLEGSRNATIFRMEYQKNTPKLHYMSSKVTKLLPLEARWFRASCNGLFVSKCDICSSYMVCNFLTREFVIVRIKIKDICGFIYDETTDEYKFILFVYEEDEVLRTMKAAYFLYGLRTKSVTSLGIFGYTASLYFSTLNLSDGAYWIGRDANECLRLMVFKFNKQCIEVKSLPGVQQCSSVNMIARRRLFNMNNTLVYKEFFKSVIRVWTLEDLDNSLWRPSNVIDLLKEFKCGLRDFYHVEVLVIEGGELLVTWPIKGMFWYNLRSKKIRKLKLGSVIPMSRLDGQGNGLSCVETLVSPKKIIQDLPKI